MFTHIRSSAPNMFAKFGWKTRTFCHKKVAKVIASSQTDYNSVLEHLCTNRQQNICAQTVDEYFARQFAVRLCTND